MASSNLTRIAVKRNPNYSRSGMQSYVHALRKWNFNPSVEGPFAFATQVQQAGSQAVFKNFSKIIGSKAAPMSSRTLALKDSSGQTGEVPAQDVQNEAEYLATVRIGTPPQSLDLDFDTGSADLWVWSTELSPCVKSKGKKTGHQIFSPSKSSTWKKTSGSTWQIQYGDGSSASGDVGTDVLDLGGLKIEGQSIELARRLSSAFVSNQGSGLLGLAFGSINTVRPKPVATPVENMITQQDIPQNAELFTAYLGNETEDSFYTFGYIDQDTVGNSDVFYTPVSTANGFWEFASTSATVNGKTVARPNNTAIADTGTTLVLVDDTTCKAIYSQIPGATESQSQQGWVFPTSTDKSTLPTVSFAVGDSLFAIKPEDLAFQDLGDGTTYGGVQSRGDMDMDILGDVFLRSVYAIFDQGNTRFGVVSRVTPSSSSSS